MSTGVAPQREAAGGRPGENQEVFGEVTEALCLFEGAAERALERVTVAWLEQGHLQFGPQHGDRGAQLVAGVVEEHALPGEGGLDPVEHGVEGTAELGDLVLARGLGEAAADLGQGDGVGLLAHPPDGPQRRTGQQPAPGRQDAAQQRAEQGQDQRQALPAPDHGVERSPDHDDERPVAGPHRVGQQPGPLAEGRGRRDAPIVEDVVADGLGHLVGRQHGGPRRRRVDHAGLRAEDLGEGLLLADLDPPGGDVALDVDRPGRQAGVDRPLQLAVEVQVDEDAGQDEDHHAADGEEQGEPAPQRHRPVWPCQEVASRSR